MIVFSKNLEESFAAFDADWKRPHLIAFTYDSDEKVVKVYPIAVESYKFVNPAPRIKGKAQKRMKSPLSNVLGLNKTIALRVYSGR